MSALSYLRHSIPIADFVPDVGPPPVAGYTAWLDASRPSTVTRLNGRASSIADRSANGHTFQQSTLASKPFLLYGAINGRPALRFNGAQKMADTTLVLNDRTWTAFYVAMVEDLATYQTLLGPAGTPASGGNQFRVDTTGRLTTNRSGVAAVFTQTNAAVTANQPFLAVQILTATTCEHRLDGVAQSGSDSNAFGGSASALLGNQEYSFGIEQLNGLIGEVVIYSTTLSSGDVDLVSAYLKSKWGTP